MRACAVLLAGAFLACTPASERASTRPVVIDPKPAVGLPQAVSGSVAASCAIEGDGEPQDNVTYHEEEELVLFGARADAAPLIRIEGGGRYALHGRWTELSSEDGDGRARVSLERPGSFRLFGFSLLHATRFRLRRPATVVEGHVWLEADYVVRVAGVSDARARVVGSTTLTSPSELSSVVSCKDLAYDGETDRATPRAEAAEAHVGRIELYDAPAGAKVFSAEAGLFFVHVDDDRDGFLHIRGERFGIRIAGWTPSVLVSRVPHGSGGPSGGRSGHGSRLKGPRARVVRRTPLVAERAGVQVVIGEVYQGTEVTRVGPAVAGAPAIELTTSDVRPISPTMLRIAEADSVQRVAGVNAARFAIAQ